MREIAVSNSSCLIALEKIGHLDLMSKIFDSIIIPPAVQGEVAQNIAWLIIKPVQNTAKLPGGRTYITYLIILKYFQVAPICVA